MRIDWFKIIVVLILIAGVGVYGWSENNRNELAKENYNKGLQIQRDKQVAEDVLSKTRQEEELKIKDREALLKEEETKRVEADTAQKTLERNACLSNAQAEYSKKWDDQCSNGIGTWINKCQGEQGEGCNECIVSDQDSKNIQTFLKETKDECYRKYPVNL